MLMKNSAANDFAPSNSRQLPSVPARAQRSANITGGSPGRGRSPSEPSSWRFVIGAAFGVGAVSFLATEVMHYLLVPDIGRSHERWLAEGFSALLVTLLTAKLVQITRERHRLMVARMQVIAEMNHHIRNALSPISLSLDETENQHLNHVISDAVDRIDWALREILPREIPLAEEQRDKLGYFQRQKT